MFEDKVIRILLMSIQRPINMQERENDINGHLFRSIHVGDKPPVDEERMNLTCSSRLRDY